MTTDLRALAERLEKATGAESAREMLRDGLLPALGINQHWRDYYNESDNRDASFCDHICDLWDAGGKIDAAVALCERVLEGWGIEVLMSDREMWRARVWRWGSETNDERGQWLSCYAPTPALALCLAIVRAKLAAPE